jgi:AcrR family transcriptional regulator
MLVHGSERAATKRPDIARAALRLFIARGVRGTTVRDIASQAGVADGTLYRHWRSKRELARTVFRECMETVAAELRRAAAGERTARDQLTAAIRSLFQCARSELLLYEMLVLPPSRDTDDFMAGATTPEDVLAAIVAGGQRRRELATDVDPRLVAECILGAVSRIAVQRRLGRLPRRLGEYEREFGSAVLALLTPGRRGRRSA